MSNYRLASLLIVAVLVILNSNVVNCIKLPDERIVGGSEISIKDVPYTLSLCYEGAFICGAVLISDRYALTAAHCIRNPGSYTVRAGSVNTHEGGIEIEIKKAILHPWRNRANDDYDLGILELNSPVSIRPVKLPEQNEPIPAGVKGIVSGWGVISAVVHILPENLRATTLPVMPKMICQMDYMNIRLTERQFCAGYFSGGRDACNGDSGGPFVIHNKLFGIVSWGFHCAEAGSPGVYTSIPALRNYIRTNTGV